MEKYVDLSKDFGILIKIKSFSDTILMSFIPDPKIHPYPSNYDDHVMLKFASDAASFLVALGLCLNIQFRGCVAFGDFYENDRSLTGNIMFEAADYFEQLKWIGVSLTPSANLIAVRNANLSTDDDDFNKNSYIPYDIQLKGIVEKNGFGVNIVKSYNEIIDFKNKMSNVLDQNDIWNKINTSKSINDILQDQLNTNPGIDPSLKIRNTLAFVKYIQQNM